jgi:hypothetical protein
MRDGCCIKYNIYLSLYVLIKLPSRSPAIYQCCFSIRLIHALFRQNIYNPLLIGCLYHIN